MIKNTILILFILVGIAYSQQSYFVDKGSTTGNIDTVRFENSFFSFEVTNYGSITDTIYVWTMENAGSMHKYPLIGGYSMYFPNTVRINTIYVQGSRDGIKRLITVFNK